MNSPGLTARTNYKNGPAELKCWPFDFAQDMPFRLNVRANGRELSCPAAHGLPHSLYGISKAKTSSNSPHASRVSFSELLGGK